MTNNTHSGSEEKDRSGKEEQRQGRMGCLEDQKYLQTASKGLTPACVGTTGFPMNAEYYVSGPASNGGSTSS